MQWYLCKVKYARLVEGKRKTITEEYLLNCVSYGDVDATIVEILASRIKNPDLDNAGKARLSDVYKMSETLLTDVEGVFYRMEVLCDMGGGKSEKDLHIVNATSPEMAIKRVHERLKHSHFDYKIIDTKETKIKGIYDKNNIVWTQDFFARMEEMEAEGFVEAGFNQIEIDFNNKSNWSPRYDDDAVEETPVVLPQHVRQLTEKITSKRRNVVVPPLHYGHRQRLPGGVKKYQPVRAVQFADDVMPTPDGEVINRNFNELADTLLTVATVDAGRKGQKKESLAAFHQRQERDMEAEINALGLNEPEPLEPIEEKFKRAMR